MKHYQFGTCEVCGRQKTRIFKLYGFCVCSKHMHQLMTHGHVLDCNPRTTKDRNTFIERADGYVDMVIYDQSCNPVCRTVIDKDTVEIIKYRKWSVNSYGYVYHNYPNTALHRVIMNANANQDVDHINGDTLDNRKCNLRLCSTSENLSNKHYISTNTSGYIGVASTKRGWAPEIRFNGIRVHLGRYKKIEDAVYARFVAAQYCFGQHANQEQIDKAIECCKDMSPHRKAELKEYVLNKLQDHFGNQLCRSPQYDYQHSGCTVGH